MPKDRAFLERFNPLPTELAGRIREGEPIS